MLWPSRNNPVLYHRGVWWVVRWLSPVEKHVRVIRTKREDYARKIYHQFIGDTKC